jgi:hypothetical protein
MDWIKLIYIIRYQKSKARLNNSKKNFHDYCSVNIIKVQQDYSSLFLIKFFIFSIKVLIKG